MVAMDLIDRARAGDGQAFQEITAPHRRELQVHCYRMLGTFQDAEEALQESLLAAWKGLDGFEGRASSKRYRDGRPAVLRRPDSAHQQLLQRYLKAWEGHDVEGFVALL